MKAKEKIEKLKEGYYIDYSDISYTRRIFLYVPDGSKWVASLNMKEFESLLSKGLIKLESKDDSPYFHPNRTTQRDIRKYVYSGVS
jgi:hypothetical protein